MHNIIINEKRNTRYINYIINYREQVYHQPSCILFWFLDEIKRPEGLIKDLFQQKLQITIITNYNCTVQYKEICTEINK